MVGRHEARRATGVLVVLATLMVTTAANAQPSDAEQAKEAYERGYAALQAGDYEQALAHYKRSYEITPRPRTLFNIAVAEERLGRVEDAIAHYAEFLSTAEERDEEFKKQARLRIAALAKRQAAPPEPQKPPAPEDTATAVTTDSSTSAPAAPREPARCPQPGDAGTLRVRSNSGADVSVDGAVVGATARRGTELVRALSAGQHEITVERSGAPPWSRRLDVARGETIRVEVAFQERYTALRWGLTGLGVAGVATGGVFGVLALRDVASSDPGERDRGKTKALLSDVIIVGGAAALYGAWRLWKRRGTTATVQRGHLGASL